MTERNHKQSNTGDALELPVAKEVLDLCSFALAEFKRELPTGDKWKLDYFLIFALLRTVGEGLKVDEKNTNLHPNIKKEIKNFLLSIKPQKPSKRNKPELTLKEVPKSIPRIYSEFISKERNMLIHEFASTLGAKQSSDPQGNKLYTISRGFYKGRDIRCVFEQAIDWWEEQLDDILTRAGASVLIEKDII